MTAEYLVGVDIGTQSAKAALYDASGRCLAEAAEPLELHAQGPDRVEQDPQNFYDATTKTIASCIEQSGIDSRSVAAVGIAGQMAGILGVGRDGRALTPYDSWLDSRCSTDLAELDRLCGDEITARTGCPPMVAHAPKLRWWKRTQPDVFDAAEKFVVPSAYVAGRLCGLGADDAYIDWTHLHFTGLVDAATSTWSAELVEAVGVPLSKLPRIVAPTDVVGALTAEAARESGLHPGTPVVAGLGDTAAGALGAGLVASGQLLDTAGTASVLAVSVPAFRADLATRTLMVMRGAVPGQWITLSYLAGGNALRWLPQALGGAEAGDDAALQSLLEEARASSDAANGPLFVPHLGGRILPASPALRGAWIGLEFAHTRADLVRAVLESVAFEYAGYFALAGELFPEIVPSDVRLIGGGSPNRLWNEIKASALGLPYLRLEGDNFTCWGAALAAGCGVGLIADMAAAALDTAPYSERIEPDARLVEIYRERGLAYRAAVESFTEAAGVPSKRQEALV